MLQSFIRVINIPANNPRSRSDLCDHPSRSQLRSTAEDDTVYVTLVVWNAPRQEGRKEGCLLIEPGEGAVKCHKAVGGEGASLILWGPAEVVCARRALALKHQDPLTRPMVLLQLNVKLSQTVNGDIKRKKEPWADHLILLHYDVILVLYSGQYWEITISYSNSNNYNNYL